MSSVTSNIADFYQYVVGVDTHAATHSYAILSAANGIVIDQTSFPTTAAGLRRAREWISRRTHGDLDAVLIAAEGTGSYGAKLSGVLSEVGYRVVEAPTPTKQRGHAKTDALDAARSTLATPVNSLRDRRAGEIHDALQVLTSARDHLNVERLRCINALTALVRTYDLGIEARKALTPKQIELIAAWRHREEPLGPRVGRAEAVHLAKRIRALDGELSQNRVALTELVEAHAPQLLQLPGIGAVTAAVVLAAWAYPGSGPRRSCLRPNRWHLPDPSILRQHSQASIEQSRRPQAEQGAEHRCPDPDAHRSRDPPLPRTAKSRRTDYQRNSPLLEALHHPPAGANYRVLTDIEASVKGHTPPTADSMGWTCF